MSDTLGNQLDEAAKKLDLVPTRHLAMLQKTTAGPVVFLFEHRRPRGEKPTLRMECAVQPHFEVRLNIRQNRLAKMERRQKYRFTFRQPAGDVVFPADAQSAKGARWSRVDDETYERLRDHDNTAWEELFCSFLALTPSSSKSGSG